MKEPGTKNAVKVVFKKKGRGTGRVPVSRAQGARSRKVGQGEDLKSILLARFTTWTEELVDVASPNVLAEALKQPTARGSFIHILQEIPGGSEKGEVDRLREQAMARALAVREELRLEAGGFQPTQWVADRLGVTRQSVDRYRKEGALLAVGSPHGNQFPACQFSADGIVPGLKEILATMDTGDFWDTLEGLITPSPSLDGKSIIEALQAVGTPEEMERIVAVAHAYANG